MSSTPDMNPTEGSLQQQSASSQQLNRSCESCRGLKVRCILDPTLPTQCQRCAKAGRACIFVAPQKRRPRKRTDSRVAQLEREMRQMRSLLKDRFRVDESDAESTDSEKEESPEPDELGIESKERLFSIPEAPSSVSASTRHTDQPGVPLSSYANTVESSSVSVPSFNPISTAFSPEMPLGDDVIDRGLIPLEYANELVAFFISELMAFAPVIVLPPGTSAAQLRRSKPVLFLSIIAAAAIAVDASIATVLNQEMVRLYAERFFVHGDKSLELVQALVLMTVFYFPPNSPLKLQHYQYTHVAATMALEIGLASKRRVSRVASGNKDKQIPFDEQMAEQARAILECYHLASTVAMKTRRPNLLLFNDWMGECVKHLENSPHAIDRHMATWFELQRIVDEAMASFGLDDTSSTTPLTETRVQAVLRWFDSRMQSWKKKIPVDMLTVPMSFEYHFTNLAVYELAIGEGYRDPDAIKQQYYTLPAPEDHRQAERASPPLSAIRVDITIKWMHAAQEMLDYFLGCDTELMRKLPNMIYSRVGVAMMSLLKIYFSVISGALGEFVSPQTVKVELYLDAMTRRLTEASGGQKYKIPSRWYYVLAIKARGWYDRLQQRQAQAEGNFAPHMDVSQPMSQIHLTVQAHQPFGPHDPHGSAEALAMTAGVPQASTYSTMGSGYAVPIVMNQMWQMDQTRSAAPVHYQYSEYQPPTIPSQYGYEPQHRGVPSDHSQSQSPLSRRTGMELDGWLPDGSIFGAPTLPGF
ncbi:C6 zinc finger domain protein [Aspergillus clavatus NRRL 1]|uniref:C6 zinc finger domain protein n=1 Tax=Aspergillus clavatus (strain ATCC 1007 / CBS 513.65 / DSM 816 / NCTC 3887 / NRRL 1 / QM 1276 / 107) TaxID=344612 RepID=A1CRS7_ASPCL|nr:C6 zinc finger domain protein [Aspergillus clavatus NRRL 1]EAW08348.1 C6 zinc finger domain protein [Aspergillus clavatus NRRL 1]